MYVSMSMYYTTETELECGMYPQSMPTEWTRARTVRPWQSVRLKETVNRHLDLSGL